MKKIHSPMARKYDVAEYLFGDSATENFDKVEDTIQQMYGDYDDRKVLEAFQRYLECKETLYFSTGICEGWTAGFGECDYHGYFEFPLPSDFVQRFYGI